MMQWRLPMPELQRRYELSGNLYFADFRWPGKIGEFDGAGKYSDPETIRREKRRDADFRAAGYETVHWRWQDLEDRARFFTILTSAMARTGVLSAVPVFPG